MGQKRYSLKGRRGNRNKEGKRGRKQGREGERVKGKRRRDCIGRMEGGTRRMEQEREE